MSDFDLPDPVEGAPASASNFDLPDGLEPGPGEITGEKKSKKWIWIVVIALVLLLCCCCVVGSYMVMQSAEGMNFNNLLNEYSMLIP
ncbi:MAG: hypothetical protein JEZ00_05580 [Anaerolineaceae bacterium]|nr:hypothetical protein [Anaerolineaceae bacterium]